MFFKKKSKTALNILNFSLWNRLMKIECEKKFNLSDTILKSCGIEKGLYV
jgi:hypothetical protein